MTCSTACRGRSGSADPAETGPVGPASSTGHGWRSGRGTGEDRRHWVIARRSVRRPEEISYYIAYCPADTTLDQLVHVAGSRWAVEECFQTAKQECGLDDYQVRRYPGWHRHITLAMAAHSRLTVLRARELDTGKAETDPLTSSR